ncbi:hypothetical protein [Microlunatus speluncae]|uniref:hypothetical protein n=1 Tax=Microlunatus speluncae TaxID=2594267 RepID=UPI001266551A|nr:hypothetical protein [Microlunatus speluncae]
MGQGSIVFRVRTGGLEDGRGRSRRDDGGSGVVVDDDLGEERAVERAPFGGFASEVETCQVVQEVEDVVESGAGAVVGAVQVIQSGVEVGQAAADTILLGLEQVDGNRVGVVGLEELDLFGFEFVLLRGQGGALVVRRNFQMAEHGVQDLADLADLGAGEADGGVGVLDAFFDAVDQ